MLSHTFLVLEVS